MSAFIHRYSAAGKAVWGRAIRFALFAMLLLPAASEAAQQVLTTTTTTAITTSTSLPGRLGGLW